MRNKGKLPDGWIERHQYQEDELNELQEYLQRIWLGPNATGRYKTYKPKKRRAKTRF